MGNQVEIREFLTTRRAKLTPDRAGLPTYGRHRRVAGLRREEVALLAGISVEYYTRLERGNARGVSDDVLDSVSRALQLDEAERAHLLDLVRAANAERPPRRAASPQRGRALAEHTGGDLLLLLIGWFMLISPQRTTAATITQATAAAEAQIVELRSRTGWGPRSSCQ